MLNYFGPLELAFVIVFSQLHLMEVWEHSNFVNLGLIFHWLISFSKFWPSFLHVHKKKSFSKPQHPNLWPGVCRGQVFPKLQWSYLEENQMPHAYMYAKANPTPSPLHLTLIGAQIATNIAFLWWNLAQTKELQQLITSWSIELFSLLLYRWEHTSLGLKC